MAIDLETLKSERTQLKESLRTLEGEQRALQGDVKALRQREIRTKREVEALSTLIDMQASELDKDSDRVSEKESENESGKEADMRSGKDS